MISPEEHAGMIARANERVLESVENRDREERTRHERARLTELLEYAKHSLVLWQQWITESTQIREQFPEDLAIGQVLWDTICECQEGIRQEQHRIANFRQEIEKCRMIIQ